jgi:hypothetical protein
MGLSGTLEAFPLSEVLRLLGRSGQTGRLMARSGEKEMRAYLQAGRLVVAWAGSDDALGEELIGRGLIDDPDWEDVASGAVACEQALQDGVSALDFDKAILDITIEGLAKMVDGREGTFAFEEGEVSDLRLETEIELDAVLGGVEERLTTWRRLRQIVPDTTRPVEFLRATAGQEVTLSDRAWNLLVQVLPSATLDDLIVSSDRTSTAFVEDFLELLTKDLAAIEGFTNPDEVDAALREAEAEDERGDAPSIVPDDPLAGAGPTGWENELASIAAREGDEEDDVEGHVPLLEGEDADFLNHAKEVDGFDFGLVGIDVGPVKGRNLLEKDDSWTGILGGESSTEADTVGPDATESADSEEESSPATVIDLGLDADSHGDDLLGSVLHRLDDVLTDDDEDGGDRDDQAAGTSLVDLPAFEPEAIESPNGWEPFLEDEESEGPETVADMDHVLVVDDADTYLEPVDDLQAEADELLAAVAALEDEEEEPTDELDGVVDISDEEPMLLERVAELLDDAEEDLPSVEKFVPYDARVVEDAEAVDDATGSAEPEERHPADDPAPGMSNLLRRRARGALAKELRSLSD